MKVSIECEKHGGHEEEAQAVILVNYTEREWETKKFGELPPAVLILKHGDHFDTLRASTDDADDVLEPFFRKLFEEAWRQMDEHTHENGDPHD